MYYEIKTFLHFYRNTLTYSWLIIILYNIKRVYYSIIQIDLFFINLKLLFKPKDRISCCIHLIQEQPVYNHYYSISYRSKYLSNCINYIKEKITEQYKRFKNNSTFMSSSTIHDFILQPSVLGHSKHFIPLIKGNARHQLLKTGN